MTKLQAYVDEGQILRSHLSSWQLIAQQWPSTSSADHQMDIAWIFYSAISIYLSGIYDYEPIWKNHFAPPSLQPTQVQDHVDSILSVTSAALDQTNITPLLFLFPLRIAGARTRTVQQQMEIKALLSRIKNDFRIASAFSSELDNLWGSAPTVWSERAGG